jgi:hypothetical protein
MVVRFWSNCKDKYVRFDQGGELGRCRAVHDLFVRHGYDVQLPGANASHQYGRAKRPHQSIGHAMRTLLEGSSLPALFWPFAFYHFLRRSNCTIHDGHDRTLFESCNGCPPDLIGIRKVVPRIINWRICLQRSSKNSTVVICH